MDLYWGEKMSHTAKVFRIGQSQAVQLPKEYRFKGKEVYIRKSPNGDVILSEKRLTWVDYFNEHSGSEGFETFMADREQDIPRDPPF